MQSEESCNTLYDMAKTHNLFLLLYIGTAFKDIERVILWLILAMAPGIWACRHNYGIMWVTYILSCK